MATGGSPVAAPPTTHSVDRLAYRSTEGLVVETVEKAVQPREVGEPLQTQRMARFPMFLQEYHRFPKGPILLADQTDDGQQLRLGELMIAEANSIAWERRSAYSRAIRTNARSPTSAIWLAATEQTDPRQWLAH